jgi:hypothetical protein
MTVNPPAEGKSDRWLLILFCGGGINDEAISSFLAVVATGFLIAGLAGVFSCATVT